MINYVICEDNPNTGSIIRGYITDYAAAKQMPCHIFLYQSHFDKVIEFAEKNLEHTNVYFLDIILNQDNMSGLTLARQIRKIDITAYLIFISSHPELSLKIFQNRLKALDYICKLDDNVQKRICDCIDTIAYETSLSGNTDISRKIMLKRTNSIYTVKLSDIMYIETRPGSRLLYCALNDGTVIEFHDSLKEVMKRLDNRFFHCHRSYIVNTRHIKELGNRKQLYSVTMNDGKVCDVSKPKWKELMNHVRA